MHRVWVCGRDVELAKFEAFLKQHETLDISALVRGSQRLAYPIKGCARAQHPRLHACVYGCRVHACAPDASRCVGGMIRPDVRF